MSNEEVGRKSKSFQTTLKQKYQENKSSIAESKSQTSIDSFFKPKLPSKVSSNSIKWMWKGTILHYQTKDVVHSEKIAAFDFDGTLAKTSLFQHGPDAWSVLFPNCLSKLKDLNKDGFKLIIFTNQSAIGRAKSSREKTIAEKTCRIGGFIAKADLPFQVFIATTQDSNFKPNIGMWHFMTKNCNGGIGVDLEKSFYVGDAAGRVNDHSDADKMFAQKCGLTYYTESEYFSGQNC